jgi:hypothetical protein
MAIPEWLDDSLHAIVEKHHERMLPFGSGPVSESVAIATLSHVADESYKRGRRDAIRELLTSDQAATRLNLTRARVLALARSRNVGWRIGRDVLFRPEDIDALRIRMPGRPRKTP